METIPSFWKLFDPIVPEAVRCRLFSTAVEVADSRGAEYNRESGPFLDAVRRKHLPKSLSRLDILKRLLENLDTLCGEDDGLKVELAPKFEEAGRIINLFQTTIIEPLVQVDNAGTEELARTTIEQLRSSAGDVARKAEAYFFNSAREVQRQALHTVVDLRDKPDDHEVSIVSIDMAQYGRHSEVTDHYGRAQAVFALNQQIADAVQSAFRSVFDERETIIVNLGDGVLVILKALPENGHPAERAYQACSRFLQSIDAANHGKDPDLRLHFRTGIATGTVAMKEARVPAANIVHCQSGGVPLAQATRLQAAAKTGEIIACAGTWNRFSEATKEKFGPEESVSGKAHEKKTIACRRSRCVPPSAEENASSTN